MKALLIIMLVLTSLMSTSFASIDSKKNDGLTEYKFVYKIDKQTFTFIEKASSYEEALDKVSMTCFKELKGSKKISIDQGMDLIDICVNPRKS